MATHSTIPEATAAETKPIPTSTAEMPPRHVSDTSDSDGEAHICYVCGLDFRTEREFSVHVKSPEHSEMASDGAGGSRKGAPASFGKGMKRIIANRKRAVAKRAGKKGPKVNSEAVEAEAAQREEDEVVYASPSEAASEQASAPSPNNDTSTSAPTSSENRFVFGGAPPKSKSTHAVSTTTHLPTTNTHRHIPAALAQTLTTLPTSTQRTLLQHTRQAELISMAHLPASALVQIARDMEVATRESARTAQKAYAEGGVRANLQRNFKSMSKAMDAGLMTTKT
ncbi:uncharacterized protein EV422DRAFT_566860 [Fimicolochytrium jonesii]|uniref:uncharacterized protein n=1 Tax=Fimicolochytrium jonesii TaxID=1396493 RepID=UPI0022FE5197|nr:uncharacterized protein EV422DRAFT_566860 [Fimicolochytrium jonesii]KAI8821780.1 hypothetical protein EV422DRAFT_566860 [Fimicolochytrium jonesii]